MAKDKSARKGRKSARGSDREAAKPAPMGTDGRPTTDEPESEGAEEEPPPPDRDVPTVVGAGASAGGLAASPRVLGALPTPTNVALVFAQHLSPQHESALPTLLATRPPLPVVQVTEGLKIEARHIYVIPPNVQMGITDGVLHLLPRS